jgi:hypothetical protein
MGLPTRGDVVIVVFPFTASGSTAHLRRDGRQERGRFSCIATFCRLTIFAPPLRRLPALPVLPFGISRATPLPTVGQLTSDIEK